MRRRHGNEHDAERRRVLVVGAGRRFASGISHYTHKLACALAERHEVSVILMRCIVPRRLYPGKERVGLPLARLEYPPELSVYDGVDWFWFPSMLRAVASLWRSKPDTVIFQWWSGAVLHSYILLALVARLRRARIIIEFHEVQDPGEAQLALARQYVRLFSHILTRLASGSVIHCEQDRSPVAERFQVGDRPIAVIPHGPYDQYCTDVATRVAPPEAFNILFFGLIRPYKGAEDLIRAFDLIPEYEIERYWLTVIGETWEGWTLPAQLIEQSRYRDRIAFTNRFVSDAEAGGHLAAADVVALPYHRSSASGVLHIAMSKGIPVIVTNVGGLPEAVAGYGGAILVPPRDPDAIRAALADAVALRGQRFDDLHSWESSVDRFEEIFVLTHDRAPSLPWSQRTPADNLTLVASERQRRHA